MGKPIKSSAALILVADQVKMQKEKKDKTCSLVTYQCWTFIFLFLVKSHHFCIAP